ncbi:NAD(P)/FAD-dependent oxidoreductase [Nocardia camponoti]|uniref:FAD/NAD(P)-binding domain-containing protein n=1 Tax=Nocardia camponoti TaxID=1616106 RepID=A0A917Q9Q6_9NOCA|nr:FAD-dependent oxidoreductase [Nocardia camponoti]GGK38800.1 hypothetical protein GCM10011591_08140 [Nocardia camponoti]
MMLTLIANQWDPECAAIRTFLTRNSVVYRWLEPSDAEGHELLTRHGFTDGDTPVLVNDAGQTLRNATEERLGSFVGLHVKPTDPDYDLVIIGGGPAGMAAAVYGASEGLHTVLLEKWAIGGQSGLTSRIENYLGFPDGISGAELTDRARRQADKFGAELVISPDVDHLARSDSGFELRFTDGGSVGGKAVIVATGVQYRTLDAPGVEEFFGAGVYYFSALTEAPQCVNSDVYIVGGANSAGQAAIYFANTAASVTLLVRADNLAKDMSTYLIEQVEANPRIHVRTSTEIVGAAGDSHLQQLTLRDKRTGAEEKVRTNWLFSFIGGTPQTAWLGPDYARDKKGYLLTGPDIIVTEGTRWNLVRAPLHLETTVPGVFAAGDVRAFNGHRVAAAVGEGSMAVMLVHRFLGE